MKKTDSGHSGPIYEIRYDARKSIEDYVLSLDKAVLAKSALVQIDGEIARQSFFPAIISATRGRHLKIAIKCTPCQVADLSKIKNDDVTFNIFFEQKEELEKFLSPLKKIEGPHNYIVQGNRNTDFQAALKLVQEHLKHPLYFSFEPYNSQDPLSLNTREIAKIIRKYDARPLPGLDLFDPRIDSRIELEPLINKADLETSYPGSDIRFSFIIPTYNSKYFLLNVLTHIVQQSFSPAHYEVLIVDDGGTDGSLGFIESYLKTENIVRNIKYFYWPKPTLDPTSTLPFRAGLSRNIGANNARGSYLVFLDSDILVPPDFLLDLQKNFQDHDVIQYVRHHIYPEKSNSYVSFANVDAPTDLYIEEESYWRPFFEHPQWSQINHYWKYTCTYCLAVRAKDFFEAGRFRRVFISYGFEDTDLGYRLHKKGLRFHLSKLVTLHLTPSKSRFGSAGAQYGRFLALSKTAKLFFLSNLDVTIYDHLHNYMGGESNYLRRAAYFLGRFLNRPSNERNESES